MRFEGKVAIVTGAASGIGRAVAQRLAREGARVMIGDVNLAGLEETADSIGAAASHALLDVSDAAAAADFVARVVGEHGGLDILCNIAGILEFSPLADLTPERWARVVAVNLGGVYNMCRSAMPNLVQRRGCVVNMASAAGLVGIPYNAAYCAS